MTDAEFRKELLKIMPGYSWTVHRTTDAIFLKATGIQSSGFNRLSTLRVERFEDDQGRVEYTVKSAGYGTKSPWAQTITDRTLARAVRHLQDHYQQKASYYSGLARSLQAGREAA